MARLVLDFRCDLRRKCLIDVACHHARCTFITLSFLLFLPQANCYPQDSRAHTAEIPSPSTDGSGSTNSGDVEISYNVIKGFLRAQKELDLTDEQVERFHDIDTKRVSLERGLYLLQNHFFNSQPRVASALEAVKQQLDREAAHAMLATLTPEQCAAGRRKFHAEILDASQRKKHHEAGTIDVFPGADAAKAILSNDLVWAIQCPSLRKQLKLTDEQSSSCDQIIKTANRGLHDVIRQCAEIPATQETTLELTFESRAFNKLYAEMDRILSREQQELYDDYCAERSRRAFEVETKESAAGDANFPPNQRFGSITAMHSNEGQYSVELCNDFLNPATTKATKVTPEQVEKLTKCLEVAQLEVAAERKEQDEARSRKRSGRGDDTIAMVQTQVVESAQQIRSLLNAEQLNTIEKEKFRGLGLAALREKEMHQSLQLSEGQISAITAILNRQPQGLKNKQTGNWFSEPGLTVEEVKRKMSEEQKLWWEAIEHNRPVYSEHFRRQKEDVYAVLSTEQKIQFETMTALEPRTPHDTK